MFRRASRVRLLTSPMPAAVLSQFLRFGSYGRVHGSQQYPRIPLRIHQCRNTGMHEFYQSELRCGKIQTNGQVLIDCLILSVIVGGVLGCGPISAAPRSSPSTQRIPKLSKQALRSCLLQPSPTSSAGIMDLFPGALRGMGSSTVPMILSVIGTVGTRILWIFGIFPSHRSLYHPLYFLSGFLIITIIMQVICYYL